MQPLIYYPTFEPPSDIWLKFALIYFEEFRPIIPWQRRNLLSDNFKRLLNETDLVNPISPDPEHGDIASEKAMQDVIRFFDKPHENSRLFNRVNIVRTWKNESLWNFTVYRDKFSWSWSEFCIKTNIGRYDDDGNIEMSEELAFLFMSYLANEIAYTQNTAIITDNNKFDRFTNGRRLNRIEINRRNQFAKGVIDLKLPKDLSEISIKKLIAFRQNYREEIRAFNEALDKIQNQIGAGILERTFIENYEKSHAEITGIIAGLGISMVSISLSAYILINNPNLEWTDYLKAILEPAGISVAGYYGLKKALADTKNERYCKKYLTQLGKL